MKIIYIKSRCNLLFNMFFYFLLWATVFNQEPNIHSVKTLNIDNVLHQNSIQAVTKDFKGFMWFGTKSGLSRYDGYRSKQFLEGKSIKVLFADSNGFLWVGTENNGLFKLDLLKDEITQVPKRLDGKITKNYSVLSITKDKQNELWLGAFNSGLFRLKNDTLDNSGVEERFKNHSVFAILEDHKSRLWVGTGFKSLHCINNDRTRVKSFSKEAGLSSTGIRSLFESSDKTLYVGTTIGIDKFVEDEESFRKTKSNFNVFVTSIRETANNTLWVGSLGSGIFNYNPKTNELKQNAYALQEFPDKIITSLYSNTPNILWVGTFYNGVLKVSLVKQSFHSETFENSNVLSLHVDNQNTFYVGTLRNGLFFKNENGYIKNYKHHKNDKNTLASNSILSLYKTSNNELWVGTFDDGITRIKLNNSEYSHHSFSKDDPNSLNENTVTAIHEDRSNNVWVGTFGGGLNLFNRKHGSFTSYTSDSTEYSIDNNNVYVIIDESEDLLWVGTMTGINLFLKKEKRFKRFPLKTKSKVYSIYKTSNNTVWLSTSDGYLYYLDRETNRFVNEQTFKNYIVHGILEDDNSVLWLSTDKGIVSFDPISKDVDFYSSIYGTGNDTFNVGPRGKMLNGKLFFGGPNGVTYFKPENIRAKKRSPIVITDLKIFEESVNVDKNSILKKPIYELDEIEIPYFKNMITLSFSDLAYFDKDAKKYEYRLLNFREQWIRSSDKKTSATFTNLDEGEYIFQVRHINSEVITSLNIIITPPFWKTSLFIYSLSVFLIFSLFTLYKVRINRIERRNRELELLVSERTSELEKQKNMVIKLDELKTKFYENVSHEFKTPLTLIIDPVRSMLNSKKLNITSLELVLDNSRRLLKMINEILGLSKLKTGTITVESENRNFHNFLEPIIHEFHQLGEITELSFSYKNSVKDLMMPLDYQKIERVVLNLLSNAFKYTDRGGKVLLEVKSTSDNLVLSISDTGIGISKEDIQHIFERFYRSENESVNEKQGTGIGLALVREIVELHEGHMDVESNVGEGSKFTISLPLRTSDISEQIEETNKGTRNKDNESVLVVEDNEQIRKYLVTNLSDKYNVHEAKNGIEGYEKSVEYMPNLIISDVMMPELDGFGLCEKLKANIVTQHIPVILLTAKSEDKDKIKGLKLEVDDYIGKPFNLDVLKEKISSLLSQRKKLRDHFKEFFLFSPKDSDVISADDRFVREVKEIIDKNIESSSFNVSLLSDQLAMSRKQLERKLKTLTNYTPNNFIRLIRLKKAEQLLEAKSGSVSEIAFQVGFNNLSYFAKSFKEEFGKLPSELVD